MYLFLRRFIPKLVKMNPERYKVHVVSRDTFNRLEVGDPYEERMIIEGFLNCESGEYCFVTVPFPSGG